MSLEVNLIIVNIFFLSVSFLPVFFLSFINNTVWFLSQVPGLNSLRFLVMQAVYVLGSNT